MRFPVVAACFAKRRRRFSPSPTASTLALGLPSSGSCCAGDGSSSVGWGKSGHVGRKIAATLASTGTPRALSAPRRSASRRPRDGLARRRRPASLPLRRVRRASCASPCAETAGGRRDRHDRKARLDPGPRRRHCFGHGRGAGSLPAQPRADNFHHGDARARRRAGRGRDGGARLRHR